MHYVEQEQSKGRKPLPFLLYKEIFVEYIQRVVDNWILQGEIFNMRGRMGPLSVEVFPMTSAKQPGIDWGTTRKLRAETKDDTIIAYYTQSWFARYVWKKRLAVVTNKKLWSFTPTRGLNGLKTKLSNLLLENEMNRFRFKHHK